MLTKFTKNLLKTFAPEHSTFFGNVFLGKSKKASKIVKTLENTGFSENTVFPKTGGEIHFWGKIRCFWGFLAFLGEFLGTNYW